MATKPLLPKDFLGNSASPRVAAAIQEFVASFDGVLPAHRQDWIRKQLEDQRRSLEAESRLRFTVSELLKSKPLPFALDIGSGFPYAGTWAITEDLNASGPCLCTNNAQEMKLVFFDDSSCNFRTMEHISIDGEGCALPPCFPRTQQASGIL